MLNFGNKDFRNLQEQVLKNMDDIRYILEEEGVLNEFGIKVVGQVEAIADLPSVSEYKAAHSDWGYGDAYAVGDEAPYELYILTRANGTHPNDYWFEIGEFPVAGPQGPQGATGATGATPSISVAANTTTLSAGQSASVSVAKSGTAAEPLLTFSFEIPQGAQGIQGIQGIQGPVGQQGPQGIQGQKGDPGYLYTIVGQVNDAQHLPLPTTVSRDAAFLVGTQEPYDVYVMIGEEAQELEWINLGEIATVIPNTFVLSDTYAESGTVDANTLASINNQTNMYFVRNGDVCLGFSGKVAGIAYFMSLGYDTGNSKTEVDRVALNLSTGAWTINVSYVDDTPTNMVTTDTTQTITGSKTFGSVIKAGFTDVSLVGLNGIAGFRAYKPGTTTQAGQMIVTNDGTVAGSYRAVIQAYNGTQDKYNTLRIGDTEGFKYYIGDELIFTIQNNGNMTSKSGFLYGSASNATAGIITYIDGVSSVTVNENPNFPIGVDINSPYVTRITSTNLNKTFTFGDPNEVDEMSIGCTTSYTITSPDKLTIAPQNGLYLFNLPSYDPEDMGSVWFNNGFLRVSGDNGGIFDTKVYASITVYDEPNDEWVNPFTYSGAKFTFPVEVATLFGSFITPEVKSRAQGLGIRCSSSSHSNIVNIPISGSSSANIQTFNNYSPLSINLDMYDEDGEEYYGYGITNTIIKIGDNEYYWSDADECYNLKPNTSFVNLTSSNAKISASLIKMGDITFSYDS